MVAGTASVEVAAGAGQERSPAEVAAGAPSVEVAADAYPARKIKTQRQMVGQMTSSVWHLLTQRHRRCQSDSGPNKMSRLRRRDLHRLVQRKLRAWMRRLRALTWPGCVRRRGRNLPHRRWQDQDEGRVDSMRLDLHRLVQRKLRAWMRRLRALTWPGCVRRRGRNLPHRRWQDRMRDKPI